MALSIEALVSKVFKDFEAITKKPEDRLGIKPDAKWASILKKSTKDVYDFCRHYDSTYSSVYINNLVIDNFDDEQVWQQLEYQNDSTAKGVLETLATSNLEKALLSFGCQKASSNIENDTRHKGMSAAEPAMKRSEREINDVDTDDTDDEIVQIKKRLNEENHDTQFTDDDSDDDELFKGSDLQEDEGDLNDDAENDINFDFDVAKKKEKGPTKRAERTPVDDKFFKLAEMEEFLQQEDEKEIRQQQKAAKQGEETSDSEEEESGDVDMFGELPSDKEEEGAMYADFFDPPDDEADDTEKKATQRVKKRKKTAEDEGEVESDENTGFQKKVHFSEDLIQKSLLASSESDDSSDDASRDVSPSNAATPFLSTFEKRQEKLQKQISAMEEASLQPKSWLMSGEVGSSLRPENSLLEEHFTFDHTSRTAPEITEETTMKLEDIIKQRIKDKSWDDVVRKERMKEEVFEFKKRLHLDQEKSKISLGEIYEQEYLKQQAEEEEDKKNPVHEEVNKMMQALFLKLDALSNFCYTPKPAMPEVKIISNMPSIAMEEVIPVAVSDAALLAPEEIQARAKGEVKGKNERTDTDKKRERRKKKMAQRERQREKEKRQKAVEKVNPGLGNKYSKERALRELEKQSKTSSNVQLVQDKKGKVSSSSTAFFAQLQEEVQTQIKAKASVAKKQKEEKKSSKKYLL